MFNLENFSDKDLYAYCKKVGFNARKWHRRFIAVLPEVAKRRLYKKYGYCSIHEFAAKLAGVTHDNVDEVLRINEKFKELPKMKALIGEVGLSKLKVVACIATKDTDDFWAKKVKNMTKSSLEIYIKEMKLLEKEKVTEKNIKTIYEYSKKFPGEAKGGNFKILQGQKQISMFDSEKSISQNSNDARVENIQNHDKKTFTIQIDNETEFELRKFKQLLEKERKEPVDWNCTLKEMVKRAINEEPNSKMIRSKHIIKSEELVRPPSPTSDSRIFPKKSQSTAVTRYIPAKIKHELKQKHNGHCAYRGCNKPAEQIHHQNRFALKHNHENLMPLCKIHHDFVHQTSDWIFNKFKQEIFVDGTYAG